MFWTVPHFFWFESGFGFLPFLFNIIVIVCLISLFVSLFGSHDQHEQDTEIDDTDTALEILKKRYAKGEITKKEFEQMKKNIG